MASKKSTKGKGTGSAAKKRDHASISGSDRNPETLNVQSVYRWVIEDVVRNAKVQFANSFSDEIFQILQESWQKKVDLAIEAKGGGGAIVPATPSSYITVPDTPSSFTSFTPQPESTPASQVTQVAAVVQASQASTNSPYRGPPLPDIHTVTATNFALAPQYSGAPALSMEPVRHVPHVQPGNFRSNPTMPNINRTPNLPLTLNNQLPNNYATLPSLTQMTAAYRHQSGDYRPSQTDGACDESIDDDKWSEARRVDGLIASKLEKKAKNKARQTKTTTKTTDESNLIPQVDGKHDAKRAKTLQNQNFYNDDDRSDDSSSHEEEPLNSDDDEDLNSDDDDDDVDAEQEPDTNDLMLCQYEKITRVKNKRKCTLSHGIMHLNGQDFVFQKAIGEIDF